MNLQGQGHAELHSKLYDDNSRSHADFELAVQALLAELDAFYPEHDVYLEVDVLAEEYLGTSNDLRQVEISDAPIHEFLLRMVTCGNVAAIDQVLRALSDLSQHLNARAASRQGDDRPIAKKYKCVADWLRTAHKLQFAGKMGGVSSTGPYSAHPAPTQQQPIPAVPEATRSSKPWQARPKHYHKAIVTMPSGGSGAFVSSLLRKEYCGKNNSWTLLFCAIATGQKEMVKCLVRWGAGVNQPIRTPTTRNALHTYCRPLLTSVYLKQMDIVQHLLENGAVPCHAPDARTDMPVAMSSAGLISTYSASCADERICELICRTYPAPVAEVITQLCSDPRERTKMLLSFCRWDSHCADLLYFNAMLLPECRAVLDVPCYTPDEKICKTFFSALAMTWLCASSPVRSAARHASDSEIADTLQRLLQTGLDPAGLSLAASGRLCQAWITKRKKERRQYGNSDHDYQFYTVAQVAREAWRRRRLHDTHEHFVAAKLAACIGVELRQVITKIIPPRVEVSHAAFAEAYLSFGFPLAVDRLLYANSTSDEAFSLLVKHGGIPGLTSPEAVPFVDGRLHDGPACQCHGVELSAAQRNVSALQVVKPATRLSLSHLCRLAVLQACDSHGGTPEQAVSQLGLPPVLEGYLLYKK